MAKSEWIRAVRAPRKKYGNQNLKDGQSDFSSKDTDGKADAETSRAKALTKKLIKAVARSRPKASK